MLEVLKTLFYYWFKEKSYIRHAIRFEWYYICKHISEEVVLSDKTKEEVLDFYGLQYNKGG